MDTQTLETFRRTLLARRTSLLARWRKALSDENELLAVREPDWQDTAATSSAIVVLDSISEQERHALARIQSSLTRIDAAATANASPVTRQSTSSAFARSPTRTAAAAAPHGRTDDGPAPASGAPPRHPARR